jgi:hypothetical protein
MCVPPAPERRGAVLACVLLSVLLMPLVVNAACSRLPCCENNVRYTRDFGGLVCLRVSDATHPACSCRAQKEAAILAVASAVSCIFFASGHPGRHRRALGRTVCQRLLSVRPASLLFPSVLLLTIYSGGLL